MGVKSIIRRVRSGIKEVAGRIKKCAKALSTRRTPPRPSTHKASAMLNDIPQQLTGVPTVHTNLVTVGKVQVSRAHADSQSHRPLSVRQDQVVIRSFSASLSFSAPPTFTAPVTAPTNPLPEQQPKEQAQEQPEEPDRPRKDMKENTAVMHHQITHAVRSSAKKTELSSPSKICVTCHSDSKSPSCLPDKDEALRRSPNAAQGTGLKVTSNARPPLKTVKISLVPGRETKPTGKWVKWLKQSEEAKQHAMSLAEQRKDACLSSPSMQCGGLTEEADNRPSSPGDAQGRGINVSSSRASPQKIFSHISPMPHSVYASPTDKDVQNKAVSPVSKAHKHDGGSQKPVAREDKKSTPRQARADKVAPAEHDMTININSPYVATSRPSSLLDLLDYSLENEDDNAPLQPAQAYSPARPRAAITHKPSLQAASRCPLSCKPVVVSSASKIPRLSDNHFECPSAPQSPSIKATCHAETLSHIASLCNINPLPLSLHPSHTHSSSCPPVLPAAASRRRCYACTMRELEKQQSANKAVSERKATLKR